MNAEFVVDATRTAWLTLALMMLLSRFAFQAAGPARMRAFLDGWKRGPVKRVWGTTGLVFAAFIGIAALRASGSFGAFDLVLVVALVTVLTLDGLVNALPAGFETLRPDSRPPGLRGHEPAGRGILISSGSSTRFWLRPPSPSVRS